MSVQITPTFIVQIEDNIERLIEDTWASVLPTLQWDRFMRQRTSSSRKENLSWMLNTAGIQPLEDGGQYPLEDLYEQSHQIVVEDFGTALEITRNEFEDADGKGINRAAEWASNVGGWEAYWPEDNLWKLVKEGENYSSYDGVPFFGVAHPTNPVIGASAGTYANLLTNAALTPSNFARAVAYIKKMIVGPNGVKRKLIPRKLVVCAEQEYQAKRILEAQTIGRDGATQYGAEDNVLRTYGFDPPYAPHELDDPDEWYIGCEIIGYQLPAFLYTVRRPYQMNTFSHLTEADLDQMQKWRWTFSGRNGVEYGHPFVFFKFKATGSGLSLTDFTTIIP